MPQVPTLKIFIAGCATCGINGWYIKRIQVYCRDNSINMEVVNSKYDDQARQEHADCIAQAGLDPAHYPAIVVQDNKVTELKKWKP